MNKLLLSVVLLSWTVACTPSANSEDKSKEVVEQLDQHVQELDSATKALEEAAHDIEESSENLEHLLKEAKEN